jgi:large subunit ribosomal protein L25
MANIVLKAKPREVIGKQVRALRRAGQVPAVIYGHNVTPLNIALDFKETTRVLQGVSSSRLITVDVDGKPHVALVRERQFHPVSGFLVHIDFQEVSMTEKLRVTVRLVFKGESAAVKDFDGIPVYNLEQLEIECLPADLPNSIEVDLSSLKVIGDSLRVRDVKLPANIEVRTSQDETVVVITPPTVEKEEVTAGAEAATVATGAEPEVIEKGKKEEEV